MRLTPLAASLPATVPFVGPETQERALGRPFFARIGANESVFGPSPKAVAAMAAAAAEAWKYADPEHHELKAALAAHHGVRPANIVVGEGIDGLLGNLVRLLVAPGAPVVTSAGAYPTFAYHVAGFGGVLLTVPYREDGEDPEALLLATRKAGAPLVYLANPDNPMGTWHAGGRIAEMIGAAARGRGALPRRGLCRLRAGGRDPGPRPGRAAGDPDADLLQGARDGRRAHRLCDRPPGAHRRVRPGAQPLRGEPASRSPARWRRWPTRPGSPTSGRGGGGAGADRRDRRGERARGAASATNFVAIDCGRDGAFARPCSTG